MRLSQKTLLPLIALMASACNTPTTEETPTLTPDMSSEEQSYYDSCPTNPECRAFHVITNGAPAVVNGTLVTENDEKAQRLLNLAEVYIENFYANAWAEQSQFFPEDYPEDQKLTREFPAGKVLGYDDQYVYITMDFTNYYPKDGTLVEQGGSGNIAFRFEYDVQAADQETLEVIDYNEAGEGMEGMSNLFPQEVLALYDQIQDGSWETPEQKTAVEERAKAFFNL